MKYKIFIILVFVSKVLVSQDTSLYDSKILNKIYHCSREYDSTILFDISSFFSDRYEINGFSYKNNRIYQRNFIIKCNRAETLYTRVKEQKRKLIKSQETISKLDKINFREIIQLNNDSLNYRIDKNGRKKLALSDGGIWTLLVIDFYSIHLKQAYDPEIFQEFAYIHDREYFLKIVNMLNELIK